MHRELSDKTRCAIHRDPEIFIRLFSGTGWAPLWIVPRLYVGWVWLSAGWAMLQRPGWMRDGSALGAPRTPGEASGVLPFAESPIGVNLLTQVPETGALDWIARLTAVGITVAGIALIVGFATGFAAFFGIVLSLNVFATGAHTPGPDIAALAVLIVLAWKTAGWIGLDRWALPLVGAPWQGGFASGRHVDRRVVPYERGERPEQS